MGKIALVGKIAAGSSQKCLAQFCFVETAGCDRGDSAALISGIDGDAGKASWNMDMEEIPHCNEYQYQYESSTLSTFLRTKWWAHGLWRKRSRPMACG